jgi:hypothetical protein
LSQQSIAKLIVSKAFGFRNKWATCQGCQMVYFQTQIPILGKFWIVLKWKVLVYYFMALWSVLRPFGIYILLSFGIFLVRLVYFFPFWNAVQRKNLATLLLP